MLASGGLDSCVLLANLAEQAQVFPIYVEAGLAWEQQEQAALTAYLDTLGHPNVVPVTVLQVPVAPLYGTSAQWSISGEDVPGAGTPDSAVFLPGRNILLIGLAAVWCSTHDVGRIAIGSLGDNPFADASPEFFADFGRVLSQGLDHQIQVVAPYRGLHKDELIRRNPHLPLELSLTCMAPKGGVHCGACNKCEERHSAFVCAGVPDRTRYLNGLE